MEISKELLREAKGVFVDTWGWIALGYHHDPHHEEVKGIYQGLRRRQIPIYTSEYVLDEMISLLFRLQRRFSEAVHFVEELLESASQGYIHIERVTPNHFSKSWNLRKRFHDKPRISFTDLTSMVIMEERGIRQVLTEDAHFIQVGMGFIKIP